MPINDCIQEEEKSQINNLILYSETLENEEHTKGKQRKEVVQIRTESNETKARKATESMLMSVWWTLWGPGPSACPGLQ